MKRGTMRHPKFRELRKLLQVHDYEVVGILESVWDVTSEFHDDGDVGRFSEQQLADAIDWPGDARQLVRSLLAAGWLDLVEGEPAVRFCVHDWLSHCPNHVWDRCKKRVQRALRSGGTAAVNPRLLAAYEKARVERNRNGAGEDDDAAGGSGPGGPPPASVRSPRSGSDSAVGDASASGRETGPPGSSGGGGRRPAASGRVRRRPAADPPNPRPETHDPRPSAAADAAAAGAASADAAGGGPASPAAAAATPATVEPVIAFPCSDGRTFAMFEDDVVRLEAEYPELHVRCDLQQLRRQTTVDAGKRVPAAEMPNRVWRWLETAKNKPELRAKPVAMAQTVGGAVVAQPAIVTGGASAAAQSKMDAYRALVGAK